MAQLNSNPNTGPNTDPNTQNPNTYVPGKTYYWEETDGDSYPDDTVYIAGNLPLIISVPHGGSMKPEDIEDRTYDRCGLSIDLINDDYTVELGYELLEKIKIRTDGKFPHMIINNLHREKIDQNRAWGEECNPTEGRGGKAWVNFHTNFLKNVAIQRVLQDHHKGLYIDLHGMPDFYDNEVHIGYNLTGPELAFPNEMLNEPNNNFIDKSSIRFLYRNLKARGIITKFSDILRGNAAGNECFGTIFESRLKLLNAAWGTIYHVVPRHDLQVPIFQDLYFAGNVYNTQVYNGTADDILSTYDYTDNYNQDNFISGFQVEICYDIRADTAIREDFADKLADAILEYLEKNFN